MFPAAALTACESQKPTPPSLNYDHFIHLDAEDLAEGGVLAAYQELLPKLRQYVPNPEVVTEDNDNDTPRYSVRCGTKVFLIYAPDIPEGHSWGRATHALFSIVNEQLESSAVRFYALYNGNELGGMFLTPSQALSARASLTNKFEWPYLPTNEPPFFGINH